MAHYSKADHLYLDFDFKRVHDKAAHRYYIPSPRLRPIFTVLRMLGLSLASPILMERTRKGWHVILHLTEKLRPAETVAAQMALGDDQKRGALNLMRALALRKCYGVTPHWRKRWNILFAGKLK